MTEMSQTREYPEGFVPWISVDEWEAAQEAKSYDTAYDTAEESDKVMLMVGAILLTLVACFVLVFLGGARSSCQDAGGQWGAAGGNTCTTPASGTSGASR